MKNCSCVEIWLPLHFLPVGTVQTERSLVVIHALQSRYCFVVGVSQEIWEEMMREGVKGDGQALELGWADLGPERDVIDDRCRYVDSSNL